MTAEKETRRSHQVLMKGDLVKLGSGIFSGWQKRFFVLFADGRLCYFKKLSDFEAGEEANAEINLKYYNAVSDITVLESNRKNVFKLTPKPMDFNYSDIREFHFAAETVTDMDMWIGSMYLMIEKYQDLKLKINKTGQVTAESFDSVEIVGA
ncbi:hypothetical protein SARC_04364 [Sphaeroforma arctica JP610]|uniref:PH domain-containing protein n=1 Tax=Sphaeroforma arctica JP610 TaxID=667725 RepID=A0A0L0G2L3_9EUKA|nr:hypothetical protein SARC_04364 [Sphaeroforma arctica JP610]KNC83377.1 hypothetical protein SARC_04364 [Sphaeroforma arctica JP610]|eukprot:XP_014157279.1 hypothetical protein SARC_04364 [Sphaeroforma arctica JP610]